MTKDLIKYLISYYQDFVSKITFEERQAFVDKQFVQQDILR